VKPIFPILTAFLLILLATTCSLAANVTLAWDPSPTPGVIGYKIYYKTGSSQSYNGTGIREGNSPIDAGSDLSLPLTDLQAGVVYTFTVTAYGADLSESSYAEAVTWSVNDPAPYIPALVYPADRAQDMPTSVVFSWTEPTDGRDISYSLVYGTDPSLSDAVTVLSTPTGHASGHPVGSAPVMAIVGLFGLTWGVARRRQLFLVAALFGLTLLLCSCGGDGNGTFDVPENNNPEGPTIQMFTSVIPNITQNSFEIYDFEPGTTYYWKITADDGITYTESTTHSFVTTAE